MQASVGLIYTLPSAVRAHKNIGLLGSSGLAVFSRVLRTYYHVWAKSKRIFQTRGRLHLLSPCIRRSTTLGTAQAGKVVFPSPLHSLRLTSEGRPMTNDQKTRTLAAGCIQGTNTQGAKKEVISSSTATDLG
jgi:hypothetical protein